MSNYTRTNVNYGLNQPLNLELSQPIVAKRAPTTADHAPIGQEWVFTTNNAVYFLTSIVNNAANWTLVTTGGAGVFTSLTVNPGPTNLSTVGDGAVTIGNAANTGSVTISVGTGNFALNGNGNTVEIAADAAANQVFLGSGTGAASTTISAGTGSISLEAPAAGGISIAAAGNVAMTPNVAAPVASPTATVVSNNRVGYATFTGFTTAAAGSQIFTVTNAIVTAASAIFVTVGNLGTNDAQMTLTRVKAGAGTFDVDTINNGAAALNGNVSITWWVIN